MLKAKLNSDENRLKFIPDIDNKKEGKEQQLHSNRMEDYLEVIYEPIQQKGYAAATDISESLYVSSPSVTKMLQRLDKNKYLRYERIEE